MSFGSPSLRPTVRDAAMAWVQRPETAVVLSAAMTIQVSMPRTPAPVIRRPRLPATPPSSTDEQHRLGAGLVDVPMVAGLDPADAILADPFVPEEIRRCGNCGKPVGRGRDGRPGLTEGFCPHCRTPFSFAPQLTSGDVVADRYEVVGVLAYGGTSWIYLTQDLRAGRRWVVLKGLINSGDPNAVAAATAEAHALVEIRHPNIVRVYDLVADASPRTGGLVDYLAMEYVSGVTLRQLKFGRDGESPSAAQVLAYGLEILSALGYLHRAGLLYVDVKPDNIIQSGERLKLIDFGAVRAIGDQTSPLWYTPGYAAPELPSQGPSVSTDLYAVGRTLHELLPHSVFTDDRFRSFRQFIDRATDEDPDRRFGSAEDMTDQLLGVLREIVATETGIPRPAPSARFEPMAGAFGLVVTHEGHYAALAPEPDEIVAALPAPRPDTGEPGDWRLAWQRGLDALAEDDLRVASAAFDEVGATLPGELAPKLALAAVAERLGDHTVAGHYYELVWAVDRGCHSAAFGLARLRLADGDHDGAEAVLRSVPGLTSPAEKSPAEKSPDGQQPPPRSRRARRSGWQAFVTGLANSLIPVPESRPRARRGTGHERFQARLHEAYTRLGPPVPIGKDRDG